MQNSKRKNNLKKKLQNLKQSNIFEINCAKVLNKLPKIQWQIQWFSMIRELPELFVCIKVYLGIPLSDDSYENQSIEIQAGHLTGL